MGDGPEFREAVSDGQECQTLQENGAESMSMELVVHGHGHFSLMGISRMVGPGGDDAKRIVLAP